MEIVPGAPAVTAPVSQQMPRFVDSAINVQELMRQHTAETLGSEITSAGADQLRETAGKRPKGHRRHRLVTCVGTLTLHATELRTGSFVFVNY